MVNVTLHRKMEVNGGLIIGQFTIGKFGKQGSSPLFLDYNGCETCYRLIIRIDKFGTTPKLECTTYHNKYWIMSQVCCRNSVENKAGKCAFRYVLVHYHHCSSKTIDLESYLALYLKAANWFEWRYLIVRCKFFT